LNETIEACTLKYFGNPVDTLYEIALARIEWFELAQSSARRRTTRRDACKKSRLPELPQITTVIFLADTRKSRGCAR